MDRKVWKSNIFETLTKVEKIDKKFEPEKGGLITLDDDLKVNSQKFEPEKKQIWTVDPQEFFRTTPNSTTLTLPHWLYHTITTTHKGQQHILAR